MSTEWNIQTIFAKWNTFIENSKIFLYRKALEIAENATVHLTVNYQYKLYCTLYCTETRQKIYTVPIPKKEQTSPKSKRVPTKSKSKKKSFMKICGKLLTNWDHGGKEGTTTICSSPNINLFDEKGFFGRASKNCLKWPWNQQLAILQSALQTLTDRVQ